MSGDYGPDSPPSFFWFLRNVPFRFYWFPRVTPGIYRLYYDGWHLAINLWVCSLEWSEG